MFRFFEAGYRRAMFTHFLDKCDEIITVSYGLMNAIKNELRSQLKYIYL